MKRSIAHAFHCGVLLGAAALGTHVPAAAQSPPSRPSVLFPSWSQRVAALGLGSGAAPLDSWAAPAPVLARDRCLVAGTVGFGAGLALELERDAPVDYPVGFDYWPARRWRSLMRLGGVLGKALVCPRPLDRSTFDPTLPLLPYRYIGAEPDGPGR